MNLRTTHSEPTDRGSFDALFAWPEDGLWSMSIRPRTLVESLHKGFCNVPYYFSSGSLRPEASRNSTLYCQRRTELGWSFRTNQALLTTRLRDVVSTEALPPLPELNPLVDRLSVLITTTMPCLHHQNIAFCTGYYP